MVKKLQVRQGHSAAADEAQAVFEFVQQIGDGPEGIVLFFCDHHYDLRRLGPLLQASFPGVVIGCTSAGQIDAGGFRQGGLTGARFSSDELRAKTYVLRSLHDTKAALSALTEDVRQRGLALPSGWKRFGLLFVDGLSLAEERLASDLYLGLGNIPVVGGSAGDDLAFEQTWVYHDGAFLNGAATFSVFETSLPFHTFKFQHFLPSARKLVITEAQPPLRLVTEINGLPAGQAYAEALGLRSSQLDAQQFSRNPLLLRLGDDHYVRSIQKMNADLSLTFYCSIEEGMVLSIGQGVDALRSATEAFARMEAALPGPAVVIGCDCVLRRVEIEGSGLSAKMGELYAKHRVLGFSTYGEQFNGMHVNQTFTGIALGGSREL